MDTVGGVHLLFGRGETGLLFDFGIPHQGLLRPSHPFTNDPIKPTTGRELRQYLLGRMAPPVLQAYDPKFLGGLSQEELQRQWGTSAGSAAPSFPKLSLFVSHMHQDHMTLLPYARERIPVYMHQDAYALYRGIAASGEYMPTRAQITLIEDLQIIDFEGFSIQLLEVDHNSAGTSGFILNCDGMKIAFTADWRRNGRHADRIDRFIERCRLEQVDVLITESTTVGKPVEGKSTRTGRISEAEVMEAYAAMLRDARGLVYVHVLTRDIERLADLITLTNAAGRCFVMDAETAVLWHEATQCGIRALDGHDALRNAEAIRVWNVGDSDMSPLPYREVTLEEIVGCKDGFAIHLNYARLPLMIELETLGVNKNPSQYFCSDHPIRIDDASLEAYLRAFGVQAHMYHSGGHAEPDEISDLIERISPKVVIPLHGRNCSQVDTRGVRCFLPERGETIQLKELIGG
ncbi:MBL fold metallo-hydrolase [Paenibacillus sp. TRM 82003]|nr:MBL fold metallo-hydrolase [Paenibacillus sp. TRM 82003]